MASLNVRLYSGKGKIECSDLKCHMDYVAIWIQIKSGHTDALT